jgi:hypothetical protein
MTSSSHLHHQRKLGHPHNRHRDLFLPAFGPQVVEIHDQVDDWEECCLWVGFQQRGVAVSQLDLLGLRGTQGRLGWSGVGWEDGVRVVQELLSADNLHFYKTNCLNFWC